MTAFKALTQNDLHCPTLTFTSKLRHHDPGHMYHHFSCSCFLFLV